jgi:hypothetical protein
MEPAATPVAKVSRNDRWGVAAAVAYIEAASANPLAAVPLQTGETATIGVSPEGLCRSLRFQFGEMRLGLQIFEEATPSVVYINTFIEQRDAFSMNIMEVGEPAAPSAPRIKLPLTIVSAGPGGDGVRLRVG